MDWLLIENPLTGLTMMQAIKHLHQKGYFDDRFPIAEHTMDPDIITLISFRAQMGTKDYNHERKLTDFETLPAIESHLPQKPEPQAMRAINNVLQKQIQESHNQVLLDQSLKIDKKKKDNGQLSLFDNAVSQLDLELHQLEELEKKTNAAFINGDINNETFTAVILYLKKSEKYYTGKISQTPMLSEKIKKIINQLEQYECPTYAYAE